MNFLGFSAFYYTTGAPKLQTYEKMRDRAPGGVVY